MSILRNVRALQQSSPNVRRIISSIKLSCQEPDSNPYFSGLLPSHALTVLENDLGILLFLPPRGRLNRAFNPQSCIRTSQSRTVEYGMTSSLHIFRMLRPRFLRMHASSLILASLFFSFAHIRTSLFLLTFGMNRDPVLRFFCPDLDTWQAFS